MAAQHGRPIKSTANIAKGMSQHCNELSYLPSLQPQSTEPINGNAGPEDEEESLSDDPNGPQRTFPAA